MKKARTEDPNALFSFVCENQVQCLNDLSVMILAKISPRGSAIMISNAETSQGADCVSDISPIL